MPAQGELVKEAFEQIKAKVAPDVVLTASPAR
jgi:hypothetical protein